MTYEFGDYKVKTKHKKFIFDEDWIADVYYKNNWFRTITFCIDEVTALRRARFAIMEHKKELNLLSNV